MARPTVPLNAAPESTHRRLLAEASNRLLQGQINCTLTVTLAASAASTTVTDARFSVNSFVGAMPTTAHAAAEIAAGGLYFAPSNGSLVIYHANNTQADRTFVLAVLG